MDSPDLISAVTEVFASNRVDAAPTGMSDFDRLREVVAELHDRKSQTATASQVRLRMDVVTEGAFSSKALGFKSFRDFLREAESRRIVALVDRPGDIFVVPFESVKRALKPRVRADLWKAVVDWHPALYQWDTESSAVVRLKSQVHEGMQLAESDIAPPGSNRPQPLISIPKLGEAEQLELLRGFVDGLELDAATKSGLLESLRGENPITATVDRIKNLGPNLARDWTLIVRDAVREAVERWKDSDARLANVEIYDPPLSEPGIVRELGTSRVVVASSDLRSRIHQAIDRMSTAELQRLQLPASVLFRDH